MNDFHEARIALADAGISDTRTLNCALNEGVRRIEDFAQYTERELLKWPNFGRKSLNHVKEVLRDNGLFLAQGDYGDQLLRGLLDMAKETRQALKDAGEAHKAALAAIEVRRNQLIAMRKPLDNSGGWVYGNC